LFVSNTFSFPKNKFIIFLITFFYRIKGVGEDLKKDPTVGDLTLSGLKNGGGMSKLTSKWGEASFQAGHAKERSFWLKPYSFTS
jgi:hypothetical protein